MSRDNVQKIPMIFSAFIWRSGWERMSRTNLLSQIQINMSQTSRSRIFNFDLVVAVKISSGNSLNIFGT